MGSMNSVREWSDILSPVNYEWDENGSVSTEEGFVYSGGLEVVCTVMFLSRKEMTPIVCFLEC